MALVKYIGPEASVYVPSEGKTCPKGSSIEVTNGTATSLLGQAGTWEAGNAETLALVPETPRSQIKGAVDPREYGARGDGTGDDSTALKRAFEAAQEKACVIEPGLYNVEKAIPTGVISAISGRNRRSVRLRATANNYIFEAGTGDIDISGLTLEAAAKQAGTGGVVDFSKGFSTQFHMSACTIGSNFFQPFKCFGPGVMSLMNFDDITLTDFATGVKGYSEAVWKFGGKSTAERTVVCKVTRVHGLANTEADVPLWFDFNNADTIHIDDYSFQFGVIGARSGFSDASALQSTNIKFTTGFFDTMSQLAFQIEKMRDFTALSTNAQNCGEGLFLGNECRGAKWHSSTIQHSKRWGARFSPSIAKGNSIRNSLISDNNENNEAGIGNVLAEAGASDFKVTHNDLGNQLNFGEHAHFGMQVAAGASDRYRITDNDCPPGAQGTFTAVDDKGTGVNKEVARNNAY